MKKSQLEQIVKEEIAKCISEIIAEHIVNESIRKIKTKTTKHTKGK